MSSPEHPEACSRRHRPTTISQSPGPGADNRCVPVPARPVQLRHNHDIQSVGACRESQATAALPIQRATLSSLESMISARGHGPHSQSSRQIPPRTQCHAPYTVRLSPSRRSGRLVPTWWPSVLSSSAESHRCLPNTEPGPEYRLAPPHPIRLT